MTNRERVMRSVKSHGKKAQSGPWFQEELKHFWALARSHGIDKDGVYDMVHSRFTGKEHLHELSRNEWLTLLHAVKTMNDPHCGFVPSGQWERIKTLQRELGWSDAHRDNYIKKHGHIDSVRFMTVAIARAVITGLTRIKLTKYAIREGDTGNYEDAPHGREDDPTAG